MDQNSYICCVSDYCYENNYLLNKYLLITKEIQTSVMKTISNISENDDFVPDRKLLSTQEVHNPISVCQHGKMIKKNEENYRSER